MRPLTWIMSRFNVSAELIGDIAEDAADRSIFWLLRESGTAILSAVASDLWSHKLPAVRSLIAAWILWIACMYATNGQVLGPRALFLPCLWAFIVGVILARLNRTQPLGSALLFMATFLVLTTPVMIQAIRWWLHPPYGLTHISFGSLFVQVGGILLFTFLGAIFRPPAFLRVAE